MADLIGVSRKQFILMLDHKLIYQQIRQMGGGGGLFEDSEKGSYQELKSDISKTCKCSLKTRIIGWIVCFAIGWLISILSTIVFLIKHDSVQFAIIYSVGQVLNITGSCFLSGPVDQAKDMFKNTRWLLTLLYVGSLIATLVLAFVLPQNLQGIVIATLIVQIVSYYLYTFSFIPYGRKMLKKMCECLVF